MQKIFDLINELQKIRINIPHFLFIGSINPNSTLLLRQSIIEFKAKNKDCKEIDFIINSPGGLADEAYRIIRTLRRNFETVNIIVPFWVKSAATLLSLGGSNIIMDEYGEFGPLDAQLGKPRDDSPEYERESALNDEHTVNIIETHFKAMYESMFLQVYEHERINISKNELSKQLLDHLSKFYEPLLKQINPYKLGDKRRKLDIAAHYAQRILFEYGADDVKNDESKVRKLVDYLVDGCPDHGFVIDFALMKLFLPNVHSGIFFGDEYKDLLSQLSVSFIEEIENETEYISFVEEKIVQVVDQTINNHSETFVITDDVHNFTPNININQAEND